MNNETKKRRKQLERLDLRRADYSYVKSLVKNLFHNHVAPSFYLDTGSPFYRVRLNPPSKPTEEKDLREPPRTSITGYQRCNSPGNPIFYASNRILTAALEVGAAENDTVYFSKWILTKPMSCSVAISSEMYECHPDIQRVVPERSIDIIDYFETLFTRPIHDTFSEQYKITAAISEMLTGEYTRALLGQDDEGDVVSSDGHMGLIYRSVVDVAEGKNFAFHPTLVDEFLVVEFVLEARVVSSANNKFVVEVMDFSDDFVGKSIGWSGNPRSIPFFDFSADSAIDLEGIKWVLKPSHAKPF